MKQLLLLTIFILSSSLFASECTLNKYGQTICENNYGILIHSNDDIEKIKIKKNYNDGYSKVKSISEREVVKVQSTDIIGEEECARGSDLCIDEEVTIKDSCDADIDYAESYTVERVYGKNTKKIKVEIKKNWRNKAIVDLNCLKQKS